MSFMTTWTHDKEETLKRLWAEGQTGSQISAVIGMSRNAVVGKAHRLGLNARPNPVETPEQRFERMVDLIADGPDMHISIEAAARTVGLRAQSANRMWRELCKRKGRSAK